jgi:hypothetical protein
MKQGGKAKKPRPCQVPKVRGKSEVFYWRKSPFANQI